MDEVDLVDSNDNITGVTTPDEAHLTGDIHRVVAVFVFDKDGRLYVQEHLKSGGKLDHSVGGHVDKGETYDEAAKREAFEELGITAPLSKISVIFSDETFRKNKMIRHMFGIYECHPGPEWVFKPNDEVHHIYPMEVEEIVRQMNEEPHNFTAGFLNTMNEYLRVKNVPLKVASFA